MTLESDPYRELLGIESEGSPDHYALLGLEPFESDPQKIDEAAGERMSVLQELANSEHLDASQKLLNEVSAARRCLLEPKKKIAYDEDLRTRQKRSAGGVGRKRVRQKQQTGIRSLPVAVAVAIVALIVVAVIFRTPAVSGNLIVEWPIEQREGASVTMDGESLAIPETDPIQVNIPNGRHRMLFRRRGYDDIPKTIDFSEVRVRLKLRWIPTK
jgi:hypothetical protein